jgi:hypothetical protein
MTGSLQKGNPSGPCAARSAAFRHISLHRTQNPRAPLSGASPDRMTWWLWRGANTRSHPELGRENPQRPWYCVLRRGRVGRCQVFQSGDIHGTIASRPGFTAGWSSPVARQAHNLKVTGSNPVPATTRARQAMPGGRSCLWRPLRNALPERAIADSLMS